MPRKPMEGKRIGELVRQLSLAAVMETIPMSATRHALQETGRES